MKTLKPFVIVCLLALVALPAFCQEKEADEHPGLSHFLQGAYQYGAVLGTNDFLNGQNATGQPIDRFYSARLEFGWQTDGSKDWHHVYNMPTFGLGLYGAAYPGSEDEIGDPTSLYGFFNWPFHRKGKWTFNFEIKFGFTNSWKPYDPVNNPNNVAFGLGRSVHIEGGPSAELRIARRWSLIGALSFTHFSNGGTQRPNHGLNQVAPTLYAKYHLGKPVSLPVARKVPFEDKDWDLTVAFSGGKRNLDLELKTAEERSEWLNRSYFIGNLTVGAGRKFSNKSRYVFGLDLGYDETVGDLIRLDAYNNGRNEGDISSWDNLELAAFAGYEAIANRTHFVLHLGYKLLYKKVEGRLPVFYQRLGVKHFVYENWFAGLNVRFHEIGSADNLEWNIGYKMKL